jgi:site-specific DNA-methyltransferase (adenine-specific)
LKEIEDNSVDAVICDPPYGIKYLGTGWDDIGDGSQQREWHRDWVSETYRVLKPNGVIKAFSSPRTSHHLIAMMDEVGFSDLKVEAWLYISGMPLSYDVAKGVECLLLFGNSNQTKFSLLKGSRREGKTGLNNIKYKQNKRSEDYKQLGAFDLEPQTKEGELYMGYGTSLKKSWEPVCRGVKR